MRVSARAVLRTLVVGLILALAVPAIALGQGISTGSGNGGTASGSTGAQSSAQSANGTGNSNQSIQQSCVAGRDCNQIANQNTTVRRFEQAAPAVRESEVRRVRLAFTGFDLTPLFVLGGLVTAGGLALLGVRRRRLASLA